MSDKKIKEEYIRVLSKIKLNEEKKEELMKITDDKKVSDKNKNFRLKYVLGLAILVMVFYGGYRFISQFGGENVSIESISIAKPEELKVEDMKVDYKEKSKVEKEMEEFSFDSFQKLLKNNKNKNMVYSPFSYNSAMGLLCASSGDETKKILQEGLKIKDFKLYEKNYRAVVAGIEKGDASKVVNSLWLNKDIKPNMKTIKNLADNFYSHFYKVDFSKKATYEQMSKFVEDATKGKLKFDTQDMEPDGGTVAIFLNSIYTKVSWAKQFEKENSQSGKFKTGKESIDLEFMNGTDKGKYFKNDNYEIGTKDFQKGYFAMFIKPNGDINEVLKRESLSDVVAKFNKIETHNEIDLYLPKFEIYSKHNLKQLSEDMGMGKIFDEADITPLGDMGKSFISKIIQGVKVSMDEKGVEGAAYTRADAMKMMAPVFEESKIKELKLDSPFIFVIYHGNTPIYMGLVENPTK